MPTVFDRMRSMGSKFDRYDIRPLLALDPRNAPPAPLPSAGASEGAFGPPAPVAGDTPAFVTGPKPNSPPGAWEATSALINKQFAKGGEMPFYKLWQQGSDEEKEAIADQVEQGFKGRGISMKEQAEQIANSSPEAMELAEEFGYQGEGAFSKKKGKWDRKAWGGFLMEVGLRILASNRGDAAGAIGEGILGTMDARRQRAMEDEDRRIFSEELERRRRREDRAEERADREEGRADRRLELQERQEERLLRMAEEDIRRAREKEKADKLVRVQDRDGYWYVVDASKPGLLKDEDGNPIRGATQNDLTRTIETWKRQIARTRESILNRIRKEVEEGSMDPEIEAIQDAPPEERDRLIMELADKRFRMIYGGIDIPVDLGGFDADEEAEVLDYNDWQ